MKELNIQIPEGFEIDETKSTFSKIVFKPILSKKSREARMTEIWRSCNNVKYSSDNCRTYFKDNEAMFQQDWNKEKLYYRHLYVYKVFTEEYNLSEYEINSLVIKVLSVDLNTKNLDGANGWGLGRSIN
jgi:hypothetical protein